MENDWWDAMATELQDAVDKKDAKVFYNGLKRVYGPREIGTSPILDTDGSTLG